MTYTKILIVLGLMTLTSCGQDASINTSIVDTKSSGVVSGSILTTGDTTTNLTIPALDTSIDPVDAD